MAHHNRQSPRAGRLDFAAIDRAARTAAAEWFDNLPDAMPAEDDEPEPEPAAAWIGPAR